MSNSSQLKAKERNEQKTGSVSSTSLRENLKPSKGFLYSCSLMHERLLPKKHKFTYPLPYFNLDLDELQTLSNKIKLFSHNSISVFSIWSKDYINSENISLKEKALSIIKDKALRDRVKKIHLITSPRYFNYVFNPVSFYYYLDSSSKPICFLAEVNNTFSEKHLYFIDEFTTSKSEDGFISKKSKAFHVSPFNDMLGDYKFYFGALGEKLDIKINLYKDDLEKNPVLHFKSSLLGDGSPLTSSNLNKHILKYPLSASLNSYRIHKEAATLYFAKKLSFFKKPNPVSPNTLQSKPHLFSKIYVGLFKKILQSVKIGFLEIRFPDGRTETYGDKSSDITSNLFIKDWSFFSRVAKGGDIAFGESYVDGLFDSKNLVNVIKIAALNTEILKGKSLLSRPKRLIDAASHKLRKNSVSKSQKNISEHYDLNNEFFSLFLDSSMTYSSAVYSDFGNLNRKLNLHEAQLNKLRLIASKADIKKEHHVLEIGCGWGSFSIDTVKRTGCKVTGLTLSIEQKKLAEERIKEAGLEDRIDIQLLDYRKVKGKFDRIVSIEMLEAVGHEFLSEYFKVIEDRLVDGGRAVIQSITIPNERYENYTKGCDWIQKYIFPGGHLPCEEILEKIISNLDTLSIKNIDHFGLDYAKTLKDWRDTFLEKREEVYSLGFDDKFIRTWEYYLIYCEAAFLAKVIDNIHLVINKNASDKNASDKNFIDKDFSL